MYQKFALRLVCVVLLCLVVVFPAVVSGDTIGSQLQSSMIWNPAGGSTVVFRKQFSISGSITQGNLYIFADSYYALYVNGQYILNGPGRFDPKRPEYDTVDVKSSLQTGTNTLAVLVYGHLSNGRHMDHVPGMALRLEGNSFTVVTDATWRCSNSTRFKNPGVEWPKIKDSIDATLESGDCLTPGFADSSWGYAGVVDGNQWGAFYPRSIPLLAETQLSVSLPFTPPCDTGSFTVNLGRNYLVSVFLDFDTTAGTTITIDGHSYKARSGRQVYRTSDSFGVSSSQVTINTTAQIHLYDVKIINRVYPFTRQGSFSCNDAVLTRLWDQSTYTLQQVTEDGYQDCPWERAEWMGDAEVVEYPNTRVAFVGPGGVYSDPRVIKKMLRDIAQSAQSDGRIKAHHPSDRWDIHAYIEDYSCLWVQSLREYYDYTGDSAFVNELWTVLKNQMQWFLDRRTANGLVNAREFVIFDNPLKYKTCEGATLNAFIYKALKDSAYLAGVVGDSQTATNYNTAATDLFNAFNLKLWTGETYNASMTDGPTYHSAMLPLNRGIVPADRIDSVRNWLATNYINASNSFMPYTHFWLFEEMYKMDSDGWDTNVLERMRTRWANMTSASNTGFTVAENFGMNRPFHNFGGVPAYFLSAYVLGVKVSGPVSNNQLVIKPCLGDLTNANGTVVTEHGLVPVSWQKSGTYIDFSFTILSGKNAEVHIPRLSNNPTLTLNGQSTSYVKELRYVMINVGSGSYTGRITSDGVPLPTATPRPTYTPTPTPTPTPSHGPNLALNKTVTASSSVEANGWFKTKAVDGQTSTVSGSMGWSSMNDSYNNHAEWITVDLGANNSINRVDLYPRNDGADAGYGFPVDFTIKVSTDNTNWTTVVTQTGYVKPGGTDQLFTFGSQNVRYLKIDATSLRSNPNDGNQYRMQFAEIEVYGGSGATSTPAPTSTPTPTPTSTPTPTPGGNLALNKTVTASTTVENTDWGKAKATDGQRSSVSGSRGWTSLDALTNHAEWVTVDLGSNKSITKVDLYPRSDGADAGYGFPVDFTIKVSTDNTNWTTVITRTGYAKPAAVVQSFTFTSQSARYVKVDATTLRSNPNDGNRYRLQFAEIEVY
jgi:alpha-L-rhamnosidase